MPGEARLDFRRIAGKRGLGGSCGWGHMTLCSSHLQCGKLLLSTSLPSTARHGAAVLHGETCHRRARLPLLPSFALRFSPLPCDRLSYSKGEKNGAFSDSHLLLCSEQLRVQEVCFLQRGGRERLEGQVTVWIY